VSNEHAIIDILKDAHGREVEKENT